LANFYKPVWTTGIRAFITCLLQESTLWAVAPLVEIPGVMNEHVQPYRYYSPGL